MNNKFDVKEIIKKKHLLKKKKVMCVVYCYKNCPNILLELSCANLIPDT